MVLSFINSVRILEPHSGREGEDEERGRERKKSKYKDRRRVLKIVHTPVPSRRGSFLAAEAVELLKHTRAHTHAHKYTFRIRHAQPSNPFHLHAHTDTHTHSHTLLSHAAQTSNKQGPVPHQWLKRRGAQLTLVPRRGRANAASSPSSLLHIQVLLLLLLL